VKTDRCLRSLFVGAGLLLAACLPAAGQIQIRIPGGTFSFESDSKKLAKALAQQVGEVKKSFETNRRALQTVPGPGGVPAYPRQEVAGLIDDTEKELDQAIERVGEPDLEPLQAWAAEELRGIREELSGPSGQTAAWLPGLPRIAARVASLGRLPLPALASVSAAAPKRETIPAETSNRLLDEVGAVVSRIFVLAERNDLEVKLWVGSIPVPKATFSFWPKGKIKGTAPASRIMRSNGKRERVLRGLYDYSAGLSQGAVTELVRYPSPAGAPASRTASERLDLVNGSSFFCCRFNEQYCHHVNDEKECRP
jgi:hypothetical protein